MALEIRKRERESVTVLDLSGRITAGEEASSLRDRLRELAAHGVKDVILNLKEVDYIDSTGLGAMVVGFTALRRVDGKLKLEHLNKRTAELLVLTKLTTVFELFSDEQDAINSFFPDRQIQHFDILNFVKEQE